ncbi:MAG: hypothetical protein U1E17_13850 [Geminicoccaceae bacterium]
MLRRVRACGLVLAALLVACPPARTASAADPRDDYRLVIDWPSLRQLAAGSDNWPMSWAADGSVLTMWGDGGGFGSRFPYVSLGLAALTGDRAATVAGGNLIGGMAPTIAPCIPRLAGTLAESRSWAACQGMAHAKSYGLLALGRSLYAWMQPGSCRTEYDGATLQRNELGTNAWVSADWRLTGLMSPTFVQKGQDHAASAVVHLYAVRRAIRDPQAPCLSVMGRPDGEILLARASRKDDLLQRSAWQWWTGTGWSREAEGAPVYREPAGIGPKLSATFLPARQRYLLILEIGGSETGQLRFMDSARPFGPWRTVLDVRFPGTTFMATILPQTVREDGFTLGFTGTGPQDALNLVDVRLEPGDP